MAKPRLLWRDAARQATVTASTTADGTEAAAVTRPHLSDVWGCTGDQAAEWLVFDLGAAVAVEGLAVLGHDLDGTETGVALEANTADSWTSPAFTLALTVTPGAALAAFFTAQTYRYWRLRFTKAQASDLRTIGRVMLGPAWELSRRPSRGRFRRGWIDPTEVRRTPGGQAHAAPARTLRTLALRWEALAEDDAEELLEAAGTLGVHSPLYAAIDPDADPAAWALYGRMTRLAAADWRAYDGGHRWTVELDLEECA